MKYDFCKIEKKWQKYWLENKTFKADNNSVKPKYYVLDMFPYPSGSGLHVGHPLGYIASDIVSRFKRCKGLNVEIKYMQGYRRSYKDNCYSGYAYYDHQWGGTDMLLRLTQNMDIKNIEFLI